VFVEEQRVPPEIELDEMDAACVHAVAYCGERAVGTARWFSNPNTLTSFTTYLQVNDESGCLRWTASSGRALC
jgi:hypothetical protein